MIEFDRVTKRYANHGGGCVAVQGAALHIRPEEFVCVLGPSGCGKSTLLNLAAGFIQPTSGHVRFESEDVREAGPDRAVVFQDPTLFPWLNVRQNVEFGLRTAGLSKAACRSRAEQALGVVGLPDGHDLYPHALSGGMRQRVAIARVLALEPRALLMDEPFGALDANSRERLQEQVLQLWEAHRRTVLFVTHSVEEAAYLADRVVIMGPPPNSIREEVLITLQRPRVRTSETMIEQVARLRAALDELPCCLPCQ